MAKERKVATRPAAPATAATVPIGSVDPEKQYRIKLVRNVRVGDTVLRPFHDNIVKGKHIAAMGDAVVSIEAY